MRIVVTRPGSGRCTIEVKTPPSKDALFIVADICHGVACLQTFQLFQQQAIVTPTMLCIFTLIMMHFAQTSFHIRLQGTGSTTLNCPSNRRCLNTIGQNLVNLFTNASVYWSILITILGYCHLADNIQYTFFLQSHSTLRTYAV